MDECVYETRAYGNWTDEDMLDIAAYLTSLSVERASGPQPPNNIPDLEESKKLQFHLSSGEELWMFTERSPKSLFDRFAVLRESTGATFSDPPASITLLLLFG